MKRSFAPLILAALLLAPLSASPAADADHSNITIDLARRTWQGIPGLERTPGGRVFVSWFTGGPKEPAPENTVVLSRSDDGGKTFTAPEAMALPRNDGTRCLDPALWIDPKGRLWYIFNRGNKDSLVHDVWARRCDEPDAATPVFGPEFRVGFEGPYAFRLNKPTVLSTGEWLMPVTHATEPIKEWFAGPKQLQGVGISTDAGQTWTLHGALKTPEWALECMITELRDGRLWLLNRTGSGVLWQSHSTDQGRTWEDPTPSTIANPGSRFFIRRLASGNLLLVNHAKSKDRSHLTAQLSTDDGATWSDGLLLDERTGVSYPDGVQDKDGNIWIVYDHNRYGPGDILLAKFREEDVAAGHDVSGAVALQHVVNKIEKSPELVAVMAADEARVAAFKAPTPEKLAAIFSDDLHYAHASGAVDNKASFIDTLTSGKLKYLMIDYDKRDFTFPAPGIALESGQARIQAITPTGKMDNIMGFLAVWRLEEGHWRFLAWQSSKLRAVEEK